MMCSFCKLYHVVKTALSKYKRKIISRPLKHIKTCRSTNAIRGKTLKCVCTTKTINMPYRNGMMIDYRENRAKLRICVEWILNPTVHTATFYCRFHLCILYFLFTLDI